MLEDLTLRKAVEFAITTEKLGAEIYEKLARRFADNAELKDLFATLAKDEVAHEREFKALLERLPPEQGPLQYEKAQYLRAMAIADVFSEERGLRKNVDQISTREDALERALNLEKSTLLYYVAMKDALGPSEALEAIISAEKRHVINVTQFMLTGEKAKAL
jgi:rubrerythrin